jgi:hypothetical protein
MLGVAIVSIYAGWKLTSQAWNLVQDNQSQVYSVQSRLASINTSITFLSAPSLSFYTAHCASVIATKLNATSNQSPTSHVLNLSEAISAKAPAPVVSIDFTTFGHNAQIRYFTASDVPAPGAQYLISETIDGVNYTFLGALPLTITPSSEDMYIGYIANNSAINNSYFYLTDPYMFAGHAYGDLQSVAKVMAGNATLVGVKEDAGNVSISIAPSSEQDTATKLCLSNETANYTAALAAYNTRLRGYKAQYTYADATLNSILPDYNYAQQKYSYALKAQTYAYVLFAISILGLTIARLWPSKTARNSSS